MNDSGHGDAERRNALPMLAMGAAAWIAGCAVFENQDRPTQMGPVGEPSDGLLRLDLRAVNPRVRRGEMALFDVTIRNASSKPLAIPATPITVLLWRYPSGKTDNLLRSMPSKAAYGPTDLRRLDPGQEMLVRVATGTGFFASPGITEFQAMIHVPEPTNATEIAVPAGRFYSGRYGIMVLD